MSNNSQLQPQPSRYSSTPSARAGESQQYHTSSLSQGSSSHSAGHATVSQQSIYSSTTTATGSWTREGQAFVSSMDHNFSQRYGSNLLDSTKEDEKGRGKLPLERWAECDNGFMDRLVRYQYPNSSQQRQN